MKFNWRFPLITGISLIGFLFNGHSQDTLRQDKKISFVDSVMAESKKYPTTTHFIYEILKNSQNIYEDGLNCSNNYDSNRDIVFSKIICTRADQFFTNA